jgi:hypothetical protein
LKTKYVKTQILFMQFKDGSAHELLKESLKRNKDYTKGCFSMGYGKAKSPTGESAMTSRPDSLTLANKATLLHSTKYYCM